MVSHPEVQTGTDLTLLMKYVHWPQDLTDASGPCLTPVIPDPKCRSTPRASSRSATSSKKNQTVFGGVNASLRSFALAVEDLGRFDPNVLAGMIRRTGFSDFRETILGPLRLFLSVS